MTVPVPEQARPDPFGCSSPGCTRHPSKGDLIIRVSPKGGPFEGLCREHLAQDQAAAPVPEQAVTAPDLARQWRAEADATWTSGNLPRTEEEDYRRKRAAVLRECADEFEAAAPAIREAERQRIANRAGMLDEVRAELDDAFQFRRPDGSRYSHVSRAWVEALLATHAASAAEAERRRLAGRPPVTPLADDPADSARIAELEAYAGQADSHREVLVSRVAELEQLAADMLSRYEDDGFHAVSQAKYDEWEATLKGSPS